MIFMKLLLLQVSSVLVGSLRGSAEISSGGSGGMIAPSSSETMSIGDNVDAHASSSLDESGNAGTTLSADLRLQGVTASHNSDATVAEATSSHPSSAFDLEKKAKDYYQAAAVTLLEEAVKILLDRVIYYHRMKKVKTELDAEIAKVQERVNHLQDLKREATDKVTECTANWQTLING